uniref:Replication termination factor 2 n=1 Tax=Cupiennius salei TaxID=6928 RepID=T1E1C2_CUPSA
MGCDGGTIPRRDELVRTKKKPEQKDKNAETVAKWKHCAISQDPLHKPIVACELGKLYNKESVLEHLLNKDNSTEVAGHIKKLSDVKELNLTEKAGFEAKTSHKGDEYVDFNDSRYMCPVTGLEMNGKQRFNFIWRCGCVLSERAIKEVKSETCHKCGKPFTHNDVIIMNGTDEEIDSLQTKMIQRRRLAKLQKKKKCESAVGPEAKKIKTEPAECSDNSLSDDHSNLSNGSGKEDKKLKSFDTKVKIEPGISSASTSGVTVSTTKEVNGKNIDAVKNGNGKVPRTNVVLPEKAQEKYSIAKDPSASEAFKSLFTSHPSAKKQDKAHWITHNPLYF